MINKSKIERVAVLLHEIADREAEVKDILGYEEPIGVVVGEIPKRHYKKKDKSGFQEYKHKGRAAPTCKKCGETGHRSHYCPQNNIIDPHDAGAVDRLQFTIIRDRKHQEMSSKEVSEMMELPEKEVRAAFASTTYGHYLINRKKSNLAAGLNEE
jgi:hypothetical protein